MSVRSPSWCEVDYGEEESDPRLELVCSAPERWIAHSIGLALPSGIRDAPVDCRGSAGKLGADLADSIAEGDHEVEAPASEFVEVLRSLGADVDASFAHDANGVGVNGFRMAPGAENVNGSVRERIEQGFGDLRSRPVPGAEEQNPTPTLRAATSRLIAPRRGSELQRGMQRLTRAFEKLAATHEVDRVVGVAPVRCAATDRDELTVAKLAEVV
jgi:hypothetical protein